MFKKLSFFEELIYENLTVLFHLRRNSQKEATLIFRNPKFLYTWVYPEVFRGLAGVAPCVYSRYNPWDRCAVTDSKTFFLLELRQCRVAPKLRGWQRVGQPASKLASLR